MIITLAHISYNILLFCVYNIWNNNNYKCKINIIVCTPYYIIMKVPLGYLPHVDINVKHTITVYRSNIHVLYQGYYYNFIINTDGMIYLIKIFIKHIWITRIIFIYTIHSQNYYYFKHYINIILYIRIHFVWSNFKNTEDNQSAKTITTRYWLDYYNGCVKF